MYVNHEVEEAGTELNNANCTYVHNQRVLNGFITNARSPQCVHIHPRFWKQSVRPIHENFQAKNVK